MSKQKRDKGDASGLPIGICIGAAVGTAIGVATHNIGLWLPIGISFSGALFGLLLGRSEYADKSEDNAADKQQQKGSEDRHEDSDHPRSES